MKKSLLVIALLAAAGISSASARTIKLSPPAGKVIIDGKLTEKCWQRSADIDKFYIYGGTPENFKPVKTQVFMSIDDRFIYLGVRCEEPLVKKMKLTGKKTDDPVWKDDGIELFLVPSPEKKEYVQIVFNADGVVFDLFKTFPSIGDGDLSWDSRALCKTYKGKDFWSLEAAIPLENLPVEKPEGNWKFHIARNRVCKNELYSFVKDIKSFHDVNQFFSLQGVKLPHLKLTVLDYTPGEGKYGHNKASVLLKNWSRTQVTATVADRTSSTDVLIGPLQQKRVHLDWEQPFDKPLCEQELVISEGKKVLRRLTLKKELNNVFIDEKHCVYFIEHNKPVKVAIPLNLTALSAAGSQIKWSVRDNKGNIMVSGITGTARGSALLRIFWSFMTPGNYKLDLALICKGKTVATVSRNLRLVNSPFQGI